MSSIEDKFIQLIGKSLLHDAFEEAIGYMEELYVQGLRFQQLKAILTDNNSSRIAVPVNPHLIYAVYDVVKYRYRLANNGTSLGLYMLLIDAYLRIGYLDAAIHVHQQYLFAVRTDQIKLVNAYYRHLNLIKIACYRHEIKEQTAISACQVLLQRLRFALPRQLYKELSYLTKDYLRCRTKMKRIDCQAWEQLSFLLR